MRLAILLLLGATFFWGLNFHLAKHMLQYVSFIEAGFWRYLFGVLFLIVFQISINKQFSFSSLRQGLSALLLIGVVGLFGFNIFFFLGLKYTSALNAALIVSLNPAFTLLFSKLLLNTPITNYHKIGISIALVGVSYLLTRGHIELLLQLKFELGDLLILLGCILFALYNVWVKKYAKDFDNASFTTATNAICLLGFIISLPIVGMSPPPLSAYDFWLSTLGIGILGTTLAYLFWNKGIQIIGPANAGIYMNVVPFATAIFAIFIGVQLEYFHLWSGLIILIGIYFVQKKVTVQA